MSNNKTRRGSNSAPARSAAQQPEGAEADRGLFAATVPRIKGTIAWICRVLAQFVCVRHGPDHH